MNRSAVLAAALICSIAMPTALLASEPAKRARAAKKPAPPCVIAPIDLALTPRISLNARRRPCARNYFGLALGSSRAGELRGLQIGLGANGVERSAIGVQLALGVNGVGEHSTGLQLAGLVSAAGESFTGLQLGGLISAAGEDVAGIQLAGLINAAGGGASGLQIAGLGNAAGDSMTGLQASLVFNAAGEGLRGAQISGLFNAAGGDSRTIQLAGLFNAIGGRASALQAAGLFNAAGQLRGLQLAGAMNAVGQGEGAQVALAYNRVQGGLAGIQIAAVNIAGAISGAQVGLVNIATRARGLQLGLVNVADEADAPIGLVSWMRRGDRAVEVWGGEALALAAGARLGTRRVTSLVGISSGPLVDGNPWGPVGGAGVKGAFGRLGVLVDALVHLLFFDGVDDKAVLAQARARIAYDLTQRLALSVGATWNLFVSRDVDGADLPLGPDWLRSGDTTVRQWPGLTAGAILRW